MGTINLFQKHSSTWYVGNSALSLEASNVILQYCIYNHCFKLAFSNPVQLHDNSCCFLYYFTFRNKFLEFSLSFTVVRMKYLHLNSQDKRKNELFHTSTFRDSRLIVTFCPNTWLCIKDDSFLIQWTHSSRKICGEKVFFGTGIVTQLCAICWNSCTDFSKKQKISEKESVSCQSVNYCCPWSTVITAKW